MRLHGTIVPLVTEINPVFRYLEAKESNMATREIIEIDEGKCDGCGACATGCHEGALRIIDGKARLVGESLCDGLGACIGECPQGAIKITRREAEAYDEAKVMDGLAKLGPKVIAAHLEHLGSGRSRVPRRWLSRFGIEAIFRACPVAEPGTTVHIEGRSRILGPYALADTASPDQSARLPVRREGHPHRGGLYCFFAGCLPRGTPCRKKPCDRLSQARPG